MPKICFLKYAGGDIFWDKCIICYWNNCRISKNEIYLYDLFFDCLKYVKLNLKLQEIVNLILSFIFKPLIVLEGTFSGQI